MNERCRIHVLPGGRMPEAKSPGAVGLDVYTRAIVAPDMCPVNQHMRRVRHSLTAEPYFLSPGDSVCIGAGFIVELPRGVAGYLEPRGSTAQAHVLVLNAAVPIDWDFRGEPYALLMNLGKSAFPISQHQRIVQFVRKPILHGSMERLREYAKASRTLRGNGSVGSTGMH